MAVNRAINDYLDNAPDMEDAVIHYKPRSDFINLTKLAKLVLIKKQEEHKEEESQEASTLWGWIWEKMVKIGKIISVTTEYEMTSE